MRAMKTPKLVVVLSALFAFACLEQAQAPRLYHAAPQAPSLKVADIVALQHLGPTLVDQGVNFGVYSEHATRMELAIFENPAADLPTRRFSMTRYGNVWNVYVEGVGVGTYYGYIAWGPNWVYEPDFKPGSLTGFVADVDDQGNRFDPNKLLIDPYAKMVTGDFDWSRSSVASGPARAQSDWGAQAKSVVVQSDYAWSANEAKWRAERASANFPDHNRSDLVIYETHVKGFTANPSDPAIVHPGSYLGFGENAKYLQDLGINAVELLPVMLKPSDGGYWGYMTLNFFTPEIDYSWSRDPRYVIDEFKRMVDQLHQHGIEVILDVVYNHFGEGGLWRQKLELGSGMLDPSTTGQMVNLDPEEIAGIYSFRGLDNSAYYALAQGNKTYWNNTGVGQDARDNHTPMRKLILDSLHYWADEMHVDGFRFDLAPVLGETDGDYNQWDNPKNTVLQDIIDDPALAKEHVPIIAEPWAAGGPGAQLGNFPASTTTPGRGWGEWNGAFRDEWRSLVNGSCTATNSTGNCTSWDDSWPLNKASWGGVDVGATLTGSQGLFAHNKRPPSDSVNFVTIHDGFTMYDLFSFDEKQNGCSPIYPECCTERLSAWCDPTSGESNNHSRNWGMDSAGEAMKRQLMRDMFVALLVSQGTPMLLGGDEWMRTQLGNNNAYSTQADNAYNWFDWGAWQANPDKQRMHDFVRKMIHFRSTHRSALAPANYQDSVPVWKSEKDDDNVNWSGRHVMMLYDDPTKGPELAILINMERAPTTFTLPPGRTWTRVVDTQSYYDTPDFLQGASADFDTSANISLDAPPVVPGATYTAQGSTIVVLESK